MSSQTEDEGIDYSDIEPRHQVPYEGGLDFALVVDNLPIVDISKKEKLIQTLEKRFAKVGPASTENGIYMPWDEQLDTSKGYAFVEFDSAEEANAAMIGLQGFPFDKKHSLLINKFTDIERYANLQDTYVEPEIEPFAVQEHLRSWLTDARGRDQAVTHHGETVAVEWFGKGGTAETVVSRKTRTQSYVSWSPQGTYLISLHPAGVQLSGGTSWAEEGLHRFLHANVKLVDISPCEKYIVTWSPDPIISTGNSSDPRQFTGEDEGNHIVIWEIKTGNILRTFPQVLHDAAPDTDGKKQMAWPAFKWSPDDKYTARIIPGQQISVYELPGMGLLEKKSIKVEGVVDFSWDPIDGHRKAEFVDGEKETKRATEHILAYWTPEISNQPARVTLLAIPSRTVLRSKNLFNVSHCTLYWHNQGDYLCVKVDRYTKNKKSITSSLEIFRMKEKDYPVEVIELNGQIIDFAWEPFGTKFAVISTSDLNFDSSSPGLTYKTDVSFYQLDNVKEDFRLLKNLPTKPVNSIRWSPRGRHVVLAALNLSQKFDLEFWDTDLFQDERKEVVWGSGIQLLSEPGLDHYGVTEVVWDPSGRFVVSLSSVWVRALENGYTLWDFRGRQLGRKLVDRFKQFLWRPRPPTLLRQEQLQSIRKNLKKFSSEFDKEDAAMENSVGAELIARRRWMIDQWNQWRASVKKEIGADTPRHSEDVEEVEEWREELVETIFEEITE